MKSVNEDLSELLAEELLELCWHNDLPLEDSIGLYSFSEAFRDHGFKIDYLKNGFNFSFGYAWNSKSKLFLASDSIERTFEEIKKGWTRTTISSPSSFYDSICEVLDKLGEKYFNKFPQEMPREQKIELRNYYYCYRNDQSKEIRRKMEEYLLGYFKEYHENVIKPSKGEGKLESSKILNKVLNEFDVESYKQELLYLYLNKNKEGVGPLRQGVRDESLIDDRWKDWYEIDDFDVFPSTGQFLRHLRALFFRELAIEKDLKFNKNYLHEEIEDKRERELFSLIDNGYSALEKIRLD